MTTAKQRIPGHQKLREVVQHTVDDVLPTLVAMDTSSGHHRAPTFFNLKTLYSHIGSPDEGYIGEQRGMFVCDLSVEQTREEDRAKIAFIFHTDTVGGTRINGNGAKRGGDYGGQEWDTPPHEMTYSPGKKMYFGRGVADVKWGALVPYVLCSTGVEYGADIMGVGVHDEETGRTNANDLNEVLKRFGATHAVVLEPTSNRIITASNGTDIFELPRDTSVETATALDMRLRAQMTPEDPIHYEGEIYEDPKQFIFKFRYKDETARDRAEAIATMIGVCNDMGVTFQQSGLPYNDNDPRELVEALKAGGFGENRKKILKSSIGSIVHSSLPWVVVGPKSNGLIHRNNEGLYRDSLFEFYNKMHRALISFPAPGR